MNYHVYEIDRVDDFVAPYRQAETDKKYLAENIARKWAKENRENHRDRLVFISWFRKSDQQRGHINPGGGHAIEGEAW